MDINISYIFLIFLNKQYYYAGNYSRGFLTFNSVYSYFMKENKMLTLNFSLNGPINGYKYCLVRPFQLEGPGFGQLYILKMAHLMDFEVI